MQRNYDAGQTANSTACIAKCLEIKAIGCIGNFSVGPVVWLIVGGHTLCLVQTHTLIRNGTTDKFVT